MTAPVAVLAVLSVVGGLLQVPGLWHVFEDWLHPVAEQLVEPTAGQDWLISAVAVALGVAGILLARSAYNAGREIVADGAARSLLEHKFFFDELYDVTFARPYQAIAEQARVLVEEPVVHGSLERIGPGGQFLGGLVGKLQTGLLRSYALVVTAGAVILAIVFLVLR